MRQTSMSMGLLLSVVVVFMATSIINKLLTYRRAGYHQRSGKGEFPPGPQCGSRRLEEGTRDSCTHQETFHRMDGTGDLCCDVVCDEYSRRLPTTGCCIASAAARTGLVPKLG